MWYTYRQNNSGGYFHDDENVGTFVSVEADGPTEADEKGLQIFEDYSDYCECCGERWFVDSDTSDAEEEPSYCGEPLRDYSGSYFENSAVLYHKDGTKEKIIFKIK